MSSSHRTPEEVREDHLATLGLHLGPVFNALKDEVVFLHGKWNQYRTLFIRSKERIDLLNEAAAYFFWDLQRTLLEDILLHLARLTDPPMSMGKTNLSLQQLPGLVPDPALKADIENLVNRAVASIKVPRDWRNRRLAHRDLSLALATSGTPLPGITPADIETSLKAFRDVLHRIEGHYWHGTQTAYEFFEGGRGTADDLLRWLQTARKVYEDNERRFEGRGAPG